MDGSFLSRPRKILGKRVIAILFYDFEVFKYDWILVLIDMDAQKETVIVNDKNELERYYTAHKNDIWA